MAITYVMSFNPIWYIPDLIGKPAGGGSIASYSSLDPTSPKPIFQDPGGINAYPNPILLDMNGTTGPLFFQVDSANPGDGYDLFVYDSQGNLIWNVNDFTPPGGGGGDVTIAQLIENIVTNNLMYRNVGTSASPALAYQLIAPGAHAGLTNADNSTYGPHTAFVKNNTSAIDSILFKTFSLGDTPLTGDITPYDYCNYSCTNTPSGESFKYVQFPITNKVQNFSGQPVELTIWARCNSGANTLTLFWAQFFGSGAGATTAIRTQIQMPITLTDQWAAYQLSSVVPTVAGNVLGGCGNDGLFLQIEYPLDASCNIDFAKPAAYPGNVAPDLDFVSYDTIEAQTNHTQTGDIRVSVNDFFWYGWVPMNDGTIGNLTNVNSSNATARANNDTYPLFALIWQLFVSNQTIAPMFTSAGTPVAYGATPEADFIALNQLSLTKQAGRLLAGVGTPSNGDNTGTNWPLGGFTGNEQTSEVVQHTHQLNFALTPGQGGTGTTTITAGASSTGGVNAPTPVGKMNLQNPVVFYNIFIKL